MSSIPIPSVIQKPDCKLDAFSEVQLIGIETTLSAETINSAISFDPKKRVLEVSTDDLRLDGSVVIYVIGVKHKTKALSKNVQIIVTFEEESIESGGAAASASNNEGGSAATVSSADKANSGVPGLVVETLDTEA